MGTWGTGPFDNDTAADWVGDLEDAEPVGRPAMVHEALAIAADAEEYLDADDGMVAVAASAVVAGIRTDASVPDDPYGPGAALLDGLRLDPGLPALALRALARVVAEDSEWRELWEEAGELDEARGALAPVVAALRGSSGGEA